MRRLLAALVALSPLAAGCLGLSLQPAGIPPSIGLPVVPGGARLEEIAGGFKLVWQAVRLPFEEEVTIPAGTTLVRLTGTVGPSDALGVYMRHAETERRRCNVPFADAWDVIPLGSATCSGLTHMDRLPDAWIMRVSARTPVSTADRVEVEFLSTPLDGLVAGLDLSQLSQREHGLEKTQILDVPSFDGTLLRVEVTLPKGPGPWPTILWSGPYNHGDRAAGVRSAWNYFVRDWAERGYAVAAADVRGYGESGGCVEVWGPNEQRDQAALVDWVAGQGWSDGRVGFYGQSYVATTAVEAAVQAPEALKAIVIVAPVNDAYNDWHFGGVPNGENVGSPIGYYQIGTDAMFEPSDPLGTAIRTGNGFCDPTVFLRANDPRAVYDSFYEERNFTARVGDVKAAVLYTQGFEDRNVKSSMILDWFNGLGAPKLGLFGHWLHQHPTRADNEILFLGWMDQFVKGKDLGFGKLPSVEVVTNAGTRRNADAWPPLQPVLATLHPDFESDRLGTAASSGEATILLDPVGDPEEVSLPVGAVPAVHQAPLADPLPLPFPTGVALESDPLEAPLHLAGQGGLRLAVTLSNAENAHVAAFLHEEKGEESRLVTWGMANLAHRYGHDRFEPVRPGERVEMTLPLLPTEWVFEPGVVLRLVIRGAAMGDWAFVPPGGSGALTLHGGEGGTMLLLPTVAGADGPTPVTATR